MTVLFSVPRAFEGAVGVAQRNAIQSWSRLCPTPSIVLVGDEPGLAEVAAGEGYEYLLVSARSPGGAPRLDAVFNAVRDRYPSETLCYLNADIVVVGQLIEALQLLGDRFERFLLVSRRIDVELGGQLTFEGAWQEALLEKATSRGTVNDGTGSDVFGFSPSTFGEIPPFALGRTAWDNWLMAEVLRRRAALVDATGAFTCLHQPHGYKHTGVPAGGVTGLHRVATTPDARRNFSLMGGAFAVRTVRDANYLVVQGASGLTVQPASFVSRAVACAWRTNSGVRHHLKRLFATVGPSEP